MIHLPTRRGAAVLLAALATSATLAACGGSDDKGSAATQAADATTATATATATTTTGAGGDTTSTSVSPLRPGQKETVLKTSKQDLRAGDLGVSMKVTKLVDPLVNNVDNAQPGNKLVGVFVKGKRKVSKDYDPTKAGASAAIVTQDGKSYGVRIIADGDCSGGFFPGAFLGVESNKAGFKGCIGFEMPKDAKPEEIVVFLTSQGDTQKASWKVPEGS